MSRYSYSYSLTILYIVIGVLVNPKGITKYSYSLYLVLKTIFYSSPSFIYIKLYTPFISRLINTIIPYS